MVSSEKNDIDVPRKAQHVTMQFAGEMLQCYDRSLLCERGQEWLPDSY